MLRVIRVSSLLAALSCFLLSAWMVVSWERDNRELRAFGAPYLETDGSIGDAIAALTDAVYNKEGFAKNKGFFLFKQLGPTPLQILEQGGDCADKSRLSAAILDEFGIDTTLVMLSPCADCPPGHTVFEARPNAERIASDPVYNIVFPSGDGQYHGVVALRNNPELLPERLDTLIEERGPQDKIAFYRAAADGAHYGYPKTINLEKTAATRMLKSVLARFVDDPELIRRPRLLEDPKLFLALASLGLGGMLLGLAGLVSLGIKRRADV